MVIGHPCSLPTAWPSTGRAQALACGPPAAFASLAPRRLGTSRGSVVNQVIGYLNRGRGGRRSSAQEEGAPQAAGGGEGEGAIGPQAWEAQGAHALQVLPGRCSKEASTSFAVLDSNPHADIRVHLAAVGHPIVGDDIYGVTPHKPHHQPNTPS
eukprot:XP_001694866.1 predicted protein [Chlamydomonas reinhardtii]